ncbi:unnamed protein product [Somion occarium]|uniref:Zn(2)-C6 fungal-type domain-containing protein n=2 Tax=Somion occarium TaxID=3059160 RepID=A0ABP1CK35_9APHY
MDNNAGGSGNVKKQEDLDGNDSKVTPKSESKPAVRTLNRVPRACNACRKQKMRCEGAENPPCKRCRHNGLECLFEKPTREASLTGEAGLERIRSLESHVADIRQTQNAIQGTLLEIVAHLRGNAQFPQRSPSAYPPAFAHQSPSMHSHSSPSISTPSAGPHPPQLMVDTTHANQPSPATASAMTPSHGQVGNMNPPSRHATNFRSPPLSATGQRPMGPNEMHQSGSHYNAQGQSAMHATTLPPFSALDSMPPPRTHPTNVSSVRYHPSVSNAKRAAPTSSNVTSADSTDAEEDDGELPASGLVAPWEVLRGLADVAIERAAQENGGESEAPSRARTSSPDPRQPRPAKRRKVIHKTPRITLFPDVVTKKIIPEAEARELFRIFYHGCSTFLPVFDASVDTYEALHERSPFAVDCICMVAAQVRDGGGKPSDTFLKCQEEVQAISCATLFSPVTRQEAVQAMILVSGWSDNGWLSGGHAVRMAMEISMHKAWPELLKRMQQNKVGTSLKDRELVISARTWFCLYLFEHQMSYGTGRPAILKDDESIWHCRMFLQHPLSIEDDMRLVSTVELMAIRERVTNNLSPSFDQPVNDQTFNVLHEADVEFRNWYATWDQAFSQKYEDAAFYRQSLQIQHLHAELYHNATALRGIDGPEDVQNMPPAQRELALRSIQIGRQILDITVNSPAYREGMKYAVHYTHATATFSASFLLRLCRLFPDQCDMNDIRNLVERLAALLSEVPGRRYALTLQLMLKRFKKRKMSQGMSQQPMSPVYDTHFAAHPDSAMARHVQPQQQQQMGAPHPYNQYQSNADHIWRGFEATSNEQLPVWLSDQTLGGASFSQNGIDAFLLPNDFLPPAPQIW